MKQTESGNFLERPIPAALLAGLIILSIIAFSVETLPDLDERTIKILKYIEWIVVAIFSAEYLYRIAVAKEKLKYVFSFYGMIDLLAILPFYLSLAVDFRSLRVLRLLRLARLFKLSRYNSAFDRLRRALVESKHELIISTALLAIAIYLSAFGIYYFEHEEQPDKFRSIFDAMWWSLATVTTVGYGDIYPITLGGRLFTFIVLICSLGLVAVPTGIFATALMSIRNEKASNP